MDAAALAAARARCAASMQHMLAMRSLDCLPDNALTALLTALPAHNRARCAVLSKRWCILLRSPAAWRTIVIEERVSDAAVLTAILRRAQGQLQHLRFLLGSGYMYINPLCQYPDGYIVTAALRDAACVQLTELSFVPAALADADEPSAHTRLAHTRARERDLDSMTYSIRLLCGF
jgi:hypothetical protein